MKKSLIVILILTCSAVYSQNNFSDIEEEVDAWFQSVSQESTINTKKAKTIDFTNYSITGDISKGILCEGTVAQFYDNTSLVPKLLLEGKVSHIAGRTVVEGVRYLTTLNGSSEIYGTFYVYNTDDYNLNLKPKKAGALKIKSSDAHYLKGFYHDRPFIVRLGDSNTVYLDRKKEGKSFTFMSADIPDITLNDDDSFDIYQILLQANEGVVMCWDNGITFKGSIKTIPIEGGLIAFLPTEGQKTVDKDDQYRASVSRENGNIVFSQDYGDDNKLLKNESWFVKDNGTISDEDYWKLDKILANCHLAKWEYRNGNYFVGTIKYDITFDGDSIMSAVTTTAGEGVLRYPNGDRFEGDVSSKSVGQFFVDGITYFSDGSKEKGNWLEKYRLSDNQLQEVVKCLNPSEAKALAIKFMRRNNFPEYTYSGTLEYFDPSSERLISIYNPRLIYEKAKKQYTCKDKDGEDAYLIFAVDDKGLRKYEIVLNDGKATYINKFTWYTNGVIESILTYTYDTRKLYLSCHFFSDGKLKSAHQYGPGNTGDNVLRKSKVADTSFDGYTSRLYDLNGNYERDIKWGIGEGESLFGGRYDLDMAPGILRLNDLKPVEIIKD